MDVAKLKQGSFGIPEQMRKAMEQQKQSHLTPKSEEPASAAKEDSNPVPVPADISGDEKKEDDELSKDLQALRKTWEDRLQITITSKDIRDYIFRGRLVKDSILAIPGFMKVTLQSLNPEELAHIDQRMAAFRDTSKWTQSGLDNENALNVLSYAWLKSVEIDDGGADKPAKPMGSTPEERLATIRKIQALAVQEVIEAWDGFQILIKIALREKRLLKKQ
jgi:hypothetical protein